MRVSVVGLWHLGEVVSAGLANLGHEVIGIDTNVDTINNLKKGIPPLKEPGLEEIIREQTENGLLRWSTQYKDLGGSDVVVLAVDTPVDENDEPDVSVLFEITKEISTYIKRDALFVVTSQVPVGTTEKLFHEIKKSNPDSLCEPAYTPENLRLGNAMECFSNPERVVFGVNSKRAEEKMTELFDGIGGARHIVKIASAEMIKHALNAFLATSLSFIYNISDVCEKVGADVTEVAEALRSDARIGREAYLDSSLGFSGGTLMRDLKTLSNMANENEIEIKVVNGVLATNEGRRKDVIKKIEKMIQKPINNSKIGVLGITYKPGTSTLRRSLSMEIITELISLGASISAFDPMADRKVFHEETGQDLSTSAIEMAKDCDALMLVTAWPEFESIDFSTLKSVMHEPFVFFDTRNFLKSKELIIKEAGLKYFGTGRK